MKTNYNVLMTVATVMFFSFNSWSQTTLAQWNFNGADANSVPGGANSPLVSSGQGSLQLVGDATTALAVFPTGINTAGVGSSDPVNTTPQTNHAWGTTTYPALGTANKQAGIQINCITANYAGIVLKFDQRLSNKAGNTYVVQYTTNRTASSPVWVDAKTFTFVPAEIGTGDIWYNSRTVDFSDITAVNNSDLTAFRIVAAFDPTTNDYLASRSTSTYDGLGSVRFDMITVIANTNLANDQFESNSKSLAIYPNPSNKELVALNQSHDIEVFDVTGKIITKAFNTKTIDTKEFKSGIYFVKTATGLTTKLIVK